MSSKMNSTDAESQANNQLKPFLGAFPGSPTSQVEKEPEDRQLLDSGIANPHEEVASDVESSLSSVCTESSFSGKAVFLHNKPWERREGSDQEVAETQPCLSETKKPVVSSYGSGTEAAGMAKVDMIQCETVQHEVVCSRTALSPEYCYSICKSEFSRESKWTRKKRFCKGNLKILTKISLLTDISLPISQQRTSSAVILLTVQNWTPEYDYRAKTTVRLYDEEAGRILKEGTEERKFDEKQDHVKFMVSLGPQQDIENSKSRKLQLQVKVQVDEMHTYKTYWDMLTVTNSIS